MLSIRVALVVIASRIVGYLTMTSSTFRSNRSKLEASISARYAHRFGAYIEMPMSSGWSGSINQVRVTTSS
jgi:hypothetical protein